MPDIYVDVGPMAVTKDPTKVAAKYAVKTKQLMRDAAIKAIRSASGFTPDKNGNPAGFHFDATLNEIAFGTYQGQPSVTCKLNGVVATYPQKRWLTQSLTGKATLAGGTADRDVMDCITAAMEASTTKDVIPFLRRQPAP